MRKIFAIILSNLSIFAAASTTMGCSMIFIDEPKMSKRMIER